MALNLYHTLSQINKIKRKELVLPIAKREVVVSPLSVGDDLILKTALISPVKLDKELMKLLWQHTEFWVGTSNVPTPDEESGVANEAGVQGVPNGKRGRKKKNPNEIDMTGGHYAKISEQEFYNTISYFDKLVLLWGIYAITYETLGPQEITCSNCEHIFTDEIKLDDILQPDSLTLFDADVPFNKYTDIIKIPYGEDYTLEFTVCIPSMADFNRVLGLVPKHELQSNLENIKSQFNTEQLMTLYTRKLAVVKNDNPEVRSESASSSEILSSIRDFINIEVGQDFFQQYSSIFSKYNVKFYKVCECPQCKQTTNQGVDIEYFFKVFR